MASNLHKDLNDLQLHVPKGFASAANSTTCQKDATGNLVWAAGGGGGSATTTNVKVSVLATNIDRLKYDDLPVTLVTGVPPEIIIVNSIIFVGDYSTGFQENSTTDLRVGFDVGVTGPLNIYLTGMRNFMNLKAVGIYSYTPIQGTSNAIFGNLAGQDLQLYSTDVFNGNFNIDVYINYTTIPA
tara:strand:+ start:385 stop:936 length:552 start_codon:yes stop_codon:yes gene_type:complete